MGRLTLIAAHIALVATIAAPAQTVSALTPPYSRDEVNTLASDQLAVMQATIPQAVKGVNTTVDSNGAFAVTFATPFVSPTPVYTADALFVGGPTKCQITARSALTVAGICYLSSPTTLPGTLTALGGLVVDPWKGRLPAGTPVMVVGREPTQ